MRDPDCGYQEGPPGEGVVCVDSQIVNWILPDITLVGVCRRHLMHFIGNVEFNL